MHCSSKDTRFRQIALQAAIVLLLLASPRASAQTTADPEIVAEIVKIKAIDNHAHPFGVVNAGQEDHECDALPVDKMEPFPMPVRLNPDNPEYIGAWRALYGYAYSDASDAHRQELIEKKHRVMREQADAYPAWVLDQLGIETMLANRISMGRGLVPPRFRWVSFVDPLLVPLNNKRASNANPDAKVFYEAEEKLLHRYLTESHLTALPTTLGAYVTAVVTATLERQKREGAVAVKFEASYLRSLEFTAADEGNAKRVYARYVNGGEPSAADYKTLQDFIFWSIAREAGRIGLAVHLHTGGGAGSYFNLTGSNPALLESVLNDPTMRKTMFVIHGGDGDYGRETAYLLSKPNVYADFSAQAFLLYPHALSDVLRAWLVRYPDKVLFGTDAFGMTPEVDWPELAWLSATTGRQALALALTGMMNDGEITREHALELARLVMRENAVRLYHLDAQTEVK